MSGEESVSRAADSDGPAPAVSGRAARTFSYTHTDPLPNLVDPENAAVVDPWSWLDLEE